MSETQQPSSVAEHAEKPAVARWRYVLPNAITLGGMMIGLMAAARAMQATPESFRQSAWLIVLCVLIDKLDGSVARLLKATSAIGGQLDSFSDFVSFGIAPASLVYMVIRSQNQGPFAMWHGDGTSILLHLLVGSYVVCACVRLARFNLLPDALPGAPKVFWGMPTTFAGAIVACLALVAFDYQWAEVLTWMPLLMCVVGFWMVANSPLPKLVPRANLWFNVFQALNILGVYVCGILQVLPEYLLGGCLFYALVGFVWGYCHRSELPQPPLRPKGL